MSDFEQWFGGSKYTQVVYPSAATKQIALDGWNAAIASMQGEAVKPEWFSITDGDNWFECPDDSAILDCVHPVSVGTEYEVMASYPSIRQTYRITKVPDDVSDDTEVELITSNGNLLYTHAPDSAARIAEQSAEISRLQKELEEARKDAERYRWLRDNSKVDWDLLYENVEVSFELDAESFNDLDEAIDAAIRQIGGGE